MRGARRSRWQMQEGRLRFIAASRAVVVVSTSLAHYKVCQIVFSRRDGSVFVTFPYFKRTEGIVSRGEAVFSQDGKSRTEIRRASLLARHQQLHVGQLPSGSYPLNSMSINNIRPAALAAFDRCLGSGA